MLFQDNFERNVDGDCIPVTEIRGFTDSTILLPNNASVLTKKQLTISAESKQVKLPNDEVTLVATVNPSEPGDEDKLQFEWTSLQQPGGSTAVKHQNGGQLQLSKLSEGLYTFKVSINIYLYQDEFVFPFYITYFFIKTNRDRNKKGLPFNCKLSCFKNK